MKKILSFLSVLFFVTLTFGQENYLLWEVSKKKHKTSYLFGTMHSNNDQVLAIGEKVLPYLYQCDAYAGEIIMQPEDMFAFLPYFFEKDSTKQCGKILSTEEMEQVTALVAEAAGEEVTVFIPFMSPFIVSAMISNPNEGNILEKHALDIYLQEKADSIENELISLESIKSQMAYIQKIDGQTQKKQLLDLIENKDEADEEMAEMMRLYLDQNLKEIKKILETASVEDPLFANGFMLERNVIQADGMMAAMKTTSVFTAIGAAHLPGEKGVIQLLLDAGFKVRPIAIQ